MCKVVKAAVAYQGYFAGNVYGHVIDVAFVDYCYMYIKIGSVDVGTLHIHEELLVKMVVKFLAANRQ